MKPRHLVTLGTVLLVGCAPASTDSDDPTAGGTPTVESAGDEASQPPASSRPALEAGSPLASAERIVVAHEGTLWVREGGEWSSRGPVESPLTIAVDGRWIVREGELQHLDEDRTCRLAEDVSIASDGLGVPLFIDDSGRVTDCSDEQVATLPPPSGADLAAFDGRAGTFITGEADAEGRVIAAGSAQGELIPTGSSVTGLSISPDGQTVAWVDVRGSSAVTTGRHIVIADVDGSNQSRVELPQMAVPVGWVDDHLVLNRLSSDDLAPDGHAYVVARDGDVQSADISGELRYVGP